MKKFQPVADDYLGGSHPAEFSKAEDQRDRSDEGRQGDGRHVSCKSDEGVLKRGGATENNQGKGLGLKDSETESPFPFPNPVTATVQREVWHHLTAALAALSPNDFGRPWPAPKRREILALLAAHPDDLCVQAAKQTREIVVSQDRAPNITGLFRRKLEELA